MPTLRAFLKRDTVLATDGSAAFKKAAKNLQKPHLKGVSPLTNVFTPTCKFCKGALSVRHAKTLQVHANKKDSLVKQSKRKFFVAGGDNRAESRLGQIKASMRRCGTLKGHCSSKYKRIPVLAAAALHRKPGIMSVLNALQLYRNDCSSGKICVAPQDAFDPDSLSWLA